mmetsp:Transcript_5409/g.14518  ORF Transcript_5409/g.14518 Transcript_5409/m.14518 type:complete len:200 (+) Transcript_5409:1453-2052(+)
MVLRNLRSRARVASRYYACTPLHAAQAKCVSSTKLLRHKVFDADDGELFCAIHASGGSRYTLYTSSMSAKTSCDSSSSNAPMFSSNCVIVVAPMIVERLNQRLRANASASCDGVRSCFLATATYSRTAFMLRLSWKRFMYDGKSVNRALSGKGLLVSYLPDSAPPASGEYANNGTLQLEGAQASASADSNSRCSRENEF